MSHIATLGSSSSKYMLKRDYGAKFLKSALISLDSAAERILMVPFFPSQPNTSIVGVFSSTEIAYYLVLFIKG